MHNFGLPCLNVIVRRAHQPSADRGISRRLPNRRHDGGGRPDGHHPIRGQPLHPGPGSRTGAELFDRSAGKLIPTPDAVALSQEGQRSYQRLDRIARAAATLSRWREGELRIAASVAPSFYGLPPVISRFRAARPGVSVSPHTFESPEVMYLVAMRHHDLGVAVLPAAGPGVTIEALPETHAVCVFPAGHKLARRKAIRAEDLTGAPLLMISGYSHLSQRIMANFTAVGVQPDIVFESWRWWPWGRGVDPGSPDREGLPQHGCRRVRLRARGVV
jgi:hypothetical protein